MPIIVELSIARLAYGSADNVVLLDALTTVRITFLFQLFFPEYVSRHS
jgi:hypothetical protein